MDREKLIANIMRECEQDGEPVTRAEAEEMADMFIYMMKLSYQMGIDLESACLEKIKKNQERFEHYEKNTDEEK